MRRRLALTLTAILAAAGAGMASSAALPQSTQAQPTPAALKAAIDHLGDFDHAIRTDAARTVRRTEASVAVPMLVAASRGHADEYVRYRALTLLSGFGGPQAAATMAELRGDHNDRIRMVVYAWFERHPDSDVLPSLLEAFGKEDSEFVRPALTRALAAQLKDPRARDVLAPLVLKGADFFRGSVIEALGEYGGTFAVSDIASVAELEGPLQQDSVIALGRLGDASQVPTLAKLQRTAPAQVQPTISAALCMLGRACAEADKYLQDTLTFASRNTGYQPLLRGVVKAQTELVLSGRKDSLGELLDAGIPAKSEAVRAPIALGVGLIAVRKPDLILDTLVARKDADAAIALLEDAFDMLAEDFEEEQFFVAIRKAYWAAPADSARRRIAEALITKLEF